MHRIRSLFMTIMLCSLFLSACQHNDNANLQITIDDCVKNPALSSGYQHKNMYNTTSLGLDLSLSSASDGKIFAEIEQFGSETLRVLDYAINPGYYRFNCYFDQHKALHSAVFTVTGRTISIPYPAISPVSLLDITPAIRHYETWISSQMPLVIRYAQSLEQAITQKNTSAARQTWLKLHASYETLGGAYQAFGDYDNRIEGGSAGLSAGVHDANFTGIHAVEYYLYASPVVSPGQWRKLDMLSKNLVGDIGALQQALPNIHIDPIDMGIRAHEILENTIQFTLSDRDDYGSHTSLDTVYSNLQGTQKVLYFMHPVLVGRYAGENQLNMHISSAMQDVDHMRQTYGFTPIMTWPLAEKEHLNSMISSLAEELADIAAITDIRRH